MNKFLIVGVFWAIGQIALGQQTRVVPSASYPTIQSALNAAANTNDTVSVAAGTYFENLVWPGGDIHLLGAGMGKTIIDGNQLESCLQITNAAANAVIEGVTFTNGSGHFAWFSGGQNYVGGGVFVDKQTAQITKPLFKNCEFLNNVAFEGGGLYVGHTGLRIENCVFLSNSTYGNTHRSMAILAESSSGQLEIIATEFKQHTNLTPLIGGMIYTNWGLGLTLEGCAIVGNSLGFALIYSNGANVSLSRTRIQGNSITNPIHGLVFIAATTSTRIANCLFDQNTSTSNHIMAIQAWNYQTNVVHCVFENNSITHTTPHVLLSGGNMELSGTIVRNNSDSSAKAISSPIGSFVGPQPTNHNIHDCNIQNGIALGTNIIDVPAGFIDAANGDYHLLPTSPCVDTGGFNPNAVASTDLDGNPRLQGGAYDMGCFEGQSMAHHPVSAGRVGDTVSGGPFDVLEINGTPGDPFRTVRVPIGSSSYMSMQQPPHLALPSKFVVFGVIGEAEPASITTVPLGIGKMMFAPEPMVTNPFIKPLFFTYTDNFNVTAPQFVGSTPTPWFSTLGPAIPFPLTMTFQGVLEESPGVYVPTNALIFVVE